jgi:hypothetical protein
MATHGAVEMIRCCRTRWPPSGLGDDFAEALGGMTGQSRLFHRGAYTNQRPGPARTTAPAEPSPRVSSGSGILQSGPCYGTRRSQDSIGVGGTARWRRNSVATELLKFVAAADAAARINQEQNAVL